MKYFRMSEWEVKWSLTWENFILYMASIPTYDAEEDKPKIETREAADLF